MEEWREKVYRFWARQKWVMPLCFIMSLINIFLVILFLELRRFSGMNNYFTFTLGADIVSLCICSALLYSIIQDKNAVSRHTHDFMILISSVSTVLFTDACCWIVQGVAGLRTWNIIANLLNYIGCVFLVFFLWRYASTALEVKGRFGMKDEGGCVEIVTREEADHYEVIIADDGVGFDPGEVKKDDGL